MKKAFFLLLSIRMKVCF